MARNKSDGFKEFLIAVRKKVGNSLTAAPLWAMKKANRRFYNKRANRHWRRTHLMKIFKKQAKAQGKEVETK